MDVPLKTAARHCALTGKAFAPGERRVCLLWRDAEGAYIRWDIVEDQAGEAMPPGEVLCRWTQRVRDTTEAAQLKRQQLAGLEEAFLALSESDTPHTPKAITARATALQLLALQLERKRVLRAVPGGFWHVREKRVIALPPAELTPANLAAAHELLAAFGS